MTIPTFPSIVPNAVDFGLKSNTQMSRSELNGVIQTLALPGDIWTAVLTFTNKFNPEARILRAFVTSLRGPAGRFYLSPPGYVRGGSGAGNPVVKGASQLGLTLTTDGWTPSSSGVLVAGDYIQIGTELKMITADVNSNSSGEATLSFTPPIRVSPADNSVINTSEPTCIMMLNDGEQARWQVQPTPLYAFSLSCMEVLY